MKAKGVVAAGHEKTAEAAAIILQNGGNAFDAAVAAHLAACVCEPVLSSLAGGGFLMARPGKGKAVLYDFFVHTPLVRRPDQETVFFPISADFGETVQEFHIGLGAFATPGTVKGLFAVHQDLCTLPMRELVQPARDFARQGVVTNRFQAYIFDIVQAVYNSDFQTKKNYSSSSQEGQLLREGDLLLQPELDGTLEMLAEEGEQSFYHGTMAASLDRLGRDEGGHVRLADLQNYSVIRRKPLRCTYRGNQLSINPPPSSGGELIVFALELLSQSGLGPSDFGTASELLRMAGVMDITDIVRRKEHGNLCEGAGSGILSPSLIKRYRAQLRYRTQLFNRPTFNRGTTHISIIDHAGNMASLTTSNGEGCGRMLPGTGIMLNNMLGEEDLHPLGFQTWKENTRISSMMAPAILDFSDGSVAALGSGGSNRLRTAILHVIINLTDHRMSMIDAVCAPRIHMEKSFLSVEGGFDANELKYLLENTSSHKIWSGSNLFFGGTHAVMHGERGFQGAGDPRRGGVALVV